MKIFSQSFSRIALCCLCIHGLFSFSAAQSTTESSKLPNVLFIVIDDLRPTLGCYGEPLLRTPNVDNLASKSILFDQTFVQQAVCGPSRISFLTSRRPDTTKLYDFFSYWRFHAGNYTSLPQHFKENGYITQSVGKVFHPGIASNHSDDSPYSWTNTPYHPSSQSFKNAKVCPNRDGTLGMNVVCPIDVPDMPEKTLPDIQISEYAVEFLRNMSESGSDQPFFLAVGFNKPHIPLKYPKKYKNLYPKSSVPLANHTSMPWRMPLVAWNPGKDLRGRDDFIKLNLTYPFGAVPNYYQINMRQSYYAATSYMDSLVGRVLAALEETGYSQNTIIAFIGDHGWALGENQEWSKYSLFTVAVRVPFIMYIPGLTYTKTDHQEKIFPYFDLFAKQEHMVFESENTTINAAQSEDIVTSPDFTKKWVFQPRYKTSCLVELVDLFPTLAEAAGIPTLPVCTNNTMKTWLCTEGASLVPLIKEVTRNMDSRGTGDNTDTPKPIPMHSLAHRLANNCSKDFIAAIPDFSWKSAVFSQYPRPSAVPQSNTELPHLVDIKIMGYSMWTPDFHYTEWVTFIPGNYTIVWEEIFGRELYLRISDPYEINNVAIFENCLPLVEVLSKQLRRGWRGALPK